MKIAEESGMTLVEALITMLVMLFGLLAMAQVLAFSVIASKTYGRDATRATASAHDKMEELNNLEFTDTTTNVTVVPPYPSNGVGLTAGGSIPPADATEGYADYVDAAGSRTTAGQAAFRRQWQVINETATLKRIIVVVTSIRGFQYGTAPSTTLVTFKTP